MAEFTQQLMRVPVETGAAHLPIPSATSGAPGPLQCSTQEVGFLNPMMSGSSTPIVLEPGLLEATTLQMIVLDSFTFFVCS